MLDPYGALFRPDVVVEPTGVGVLNDLTFSVKDTLDVAGVPTAAGNPDWLRSHQPPTHHAAIIDTLLRQGATLHGKTHTDELMFSLNGENVHYGTPVNPRAEDRVPGGSSSGAAVAVASGLSDFAMGTDTGGSVRIPASFCGVYGIRPTHGRVSAEGVTPLTSSFCTVGWMAPTADRLALVGKAVFDDDGDEDPAFARFIIPNDAIALVDPEVRSGFERVIQCLSRAFQIETTVLAPQGLDSWMDTFRTMQGYEVWQTHGAWIESERPTFGPGIRERFDWTKTVSIDAYDAAREKRMEVRAALDKCLAKDTVFILPTAPGPAPRKNSPVSELETWRHQVFGLTCIAGLGGLPQVTLPLLGSHGLPVGLSIIAGRGEDVRLLHLAQRVDALVRADMENA